jgi:hypothetical protein
MSVCMEEIGTRWPDFREILYLGVLLKSVWITQVLLKSDIYNRHLT